MSDLSELLKEELGLPEVDLLKNKEIDKATDKVVDAVPKPVRKNILSKLISGIFGKRN